MNLTPASSSDLPSEAILTRVSESGTRFTHTAIFITRHRRLSATGHQWSRKAEKCAHKKPAPAPAGNGGKLTADGRRRLQKSVLTLSCRCRGNPGVTHRWTGAPGSVGFGA